MRLAIDHTTTYQFAGPIRKGLQRLRLTPLASRGQTVIAWDIECDGASVECGYDDEYANRVTLTALAPGVSQVTIRAHGLVETRDEAGMVGRHSGYLPLWHFTRDTALTARGDRVAALVAGLGGEAANDQLATLHTLTERVRAAVVYTLGSSDVATTAEAALNAGRGVCQDQAHVFIAGARALGIPARYVSGYLLIEGREEQEAGHGWAEGFVDGLGWIGFDIANEICPDDRYVRVAAGRDYRDAAPVKGLVTAMPPEPGAKPERDRMTITLRVQALPNA
jgi:transglutaminase-like putative cysteine protease